MLTNPVWKVLLVDDDGDDYFLTRAMLAEVHGRKYELDWAATYDAGRKALAENRYDAVLMDYDLGVRNSLELIRETAESGSATPVILYTGRAGPDVDVQALEAGAALFLSKGEANPRLLDRSIRYAIERKRANALLEQQKVELEEKNRLLEQLLAAREEGERRYRSLFEGMIEGFALHEIVLDADGRPCDYRFLEINPAFERLTGLKRLDVVGRRMTELLPGEDPRWIEMYGQVALTGQPVHFDNYSPTLQQHFDVYAYSPAPLQFAVIFMDVTEREQMVARLGEAVTEAESNQSQMEAVFDAQCDVVLIYAADLTVRRANPVFDAVYGFDPVGLTIGQIMERIDCRRLDGQPVALSELPSSRALRGEKVSGMRFLVTRGDGSQGAVEASSGPVRVGGQITGSVTVWHDITEQALAEQKLRQSEERYRSAFKDSQSYAAQLESLNRELQDFTFIASHDLQEPLRKIQAFGKRLQDKAAAKLSVEEADWLGRMVAAAGRMQTMIQGLLAYSRVTTRGQAGASVNLGQVVAEALSDLEVSIETSQGRVEVGELPTLQADPLQMRQLFQNLIGNALKFSRPGEAPRVKVWGQALPETGAAQIYVEDNGIGFDEAHLGQLFQPFHRLVSRSEYEGSGIGLAICRKIVERHRGSLTARSAPGQGAAFIITLPLEQG